MKINIFIADDHQLFKDSLKFALEIFKLNVVGMADNGIDLLNKLKRIKPDIILLDINMPKMNGIDALIKIKQLYPSIKIIVISMYDENAMIEHFYSIGAYAFLNKNTDLELVVETIDLVSKNKFVPRVITHQKEKNNKNLTTNFSKREAEVSTLICDGKSNKQIADILHVTNKTVEAHKKKLFTKTNTHSSLEFVSYILKRERGYVR